MQALAWIFRVAIVLVLVWFAVRNGQDVEIRAFPEQSWKAPLIFVMLVAFLAGVLIGLTAWLPTVVRQRREIGRLRKSAALPLPVPVSVPDAPVAAVPPAPAGAPRGIDGV